MRRNNVESQIIGDLADHVQTRSSVKTQKHTTLISEMEPKHIDDAMQDDNWVDQHKKRLINFRRMIFRN